MPNFLQNYFWDVQFKNLKTEDDRVFIVSRLLEMGRVDAVKWVFNFYPKSEIKNIIDLDFNISSKTKNLVKSLL